MNISGYNLDMIRGDSETVTVTCTDSEGVAVNFETGDTVTLTIKESEASTSAMYQSAKTTFTAGAAVFDFLPEDTADFKFRTYVYDVQLVREDGTTKTIIPMSNFTINPEITTPTQA